MKLSYITLLAPLLLNPILAADSKKTTTLSKKKSNTDVSSSSIISSSSISSKKKDTKKTTTTLSKKKSTGESTIESSISSSSSLASILSSSSSIKSTASVSSSSSSSSSNSTIDDSSIIRGISIGGWLVTEPYITPSIYKEANKQANITKAPFSIVDEYTLCQTLGSTKAFSLLNNHWNNWINESDFKQMSEAGFNLVRLPIGYWAWKNSNGSYINNIKFDDPFVGEGKQLELLDKAVEWADKYNLNVWIDFHGAPGSQNGYDNSGQYRWTGPSWLNATNTKELTLAIWKDLFNRYSDKGNVVGIELVNEPLAGNVPIDDITKMYKTGETYYKDMIKSNPDSNMKLILHDAFQGLGYWNNMTKLNGDILIDHHHYEVFSDWQLNNTQWNRLFDIADYSRQIASDEIGNGSRSIVGEWSGAITDCPYWLNGVNYGARYDRTYYSEKANGRCSTKNITNNNEYNKSVREFIEMQLMVFEANAGGWIFWNWKTENDYTFEWDFQRLNKMGLFPKPFNNYTYFESHGHKTYKIGSGDRSDDITDNYAMEPHLYESLSYQQYTHTHNGSNTPFSFHPITTSSTSSTANNNTNGSYITGIGFTGTYQAPTSYSDPYDALPTTTSKKANETAFTPTENSKKKKNAGERLSVQFISMLLGFVAMLI